MTERGILKPKYFFLWLIQFAGFWWLTKNLTLALATTIPFSASCFWMTEYGDDIGARTGYWTRGFKLIDQPTPGIFVKGFGWIGYTLLTLAPLLEFFKER